MRRTDTRMLRACAASCRVDGSGSPMSFGGGWRGGGASPRVHSVRSIFGFFVLLLLGWAAFWAEAARGSSKSRDFYKILGLPRTASTREVKKRYRELSKEYHPDNNPDADPQVYLDIRDAHEILTDDKLRHTYDQHGEAGLDPSAGAEHSGGPFGGSGGFTFGGFGGGGGSHRIIIRGPNGEPIEVHTSGGGGDFFNFPFGGGGGPRFREPPPADLYGGDKSAVTSVSPNSWEAIVRETDFGALVNFYNPGCSHCVTLRPVYEKLAKSNLAKVLSVTAVNCATHARLCNDVAHYPTIRLILHRGTRQFEYNGDLTEQGIQRWIDQVVPLGGERLETVAALERFLRGNKDDKALVLYVSDRPVVPLFVRAAAAEVAGRIQLGFLCLTSPGGKSIRQRFFAKATWASQLPLLMHVTDVDAVDGSVVPLKTQSKEVLSLALTRISMHHRDPPGGLVSELGRRKFERGDCGPSDSETCFILVTALRRLQPDQVPEIRAFRAAAAKFSTDKAKFFWVSAEKQAKFAEAFDFSPAVEGCARPSAAAVDPRCFKLVAFKGKRKRYKPLANSADKWEAVFEDFIDGAINGGQPFPNKPSRTLVLV